MANNVTEATLRIVAEVQDLISGPLVRAAGVTERAQQAALGMLDALRQLNQAELLAAGGAEKLAASEEKLASKLPKIVTFLDEMAASSRAAGAAISTTQLGAIDSVNGLTAALERAKLAQKDLFSGTKIGSGLSAFVAQSEEALQAIRATQVGAVDSVEKLGAAFDLPIRRAAELRKATTLLSLRPYLELEAALEEIGISGQRAADVLTKVRPPAITAAQIDRVSASLRGLGLSAAETQAALQGFGLVRIDPTPVQRLEQAFERLGVSGSLARAEIDKLRAPKIDVTKLGEARAALQAFGLTARETEAVLLRLGARSRTFSENLVREVVTPLQAASERAGKAVTSTAAFFITGFLVFNKLREGTTAALAFSRAMAQVSSIVDTTKTDVAGLRDEVLSLSREFGLKELDVAKGLYFTLSSGIDDTTEALKLLRSANELAVSGFADSQEVIDLLTTTINAYGLGVEDASRLNDIFFATVKSGKAELPELAAALGTVLPIAAQLGVKVEEVNAAVAALTLGGRKADIATTGLRQVLINLLNPTADAQAILRGLDEQFGIFGGKTIPEIIREGGSLFEVFTKLRQAVGGNTEALREILPDARAFTVAAALTGEQYETLRRVLDDVTNSVGDNQAALEKVLASPAQRFQQIAAGIRQGLLGIGDSIVSAIIPATATMRDLETASRDVAQAISGIGTAFTEGLGPIKLFGTGFLVVSSAMVDAIQGINAVAGTINDDLAKSLAPLQGRLEAAQRSIQRLLGFTSEDELELEFLKNRDALQNLNIEIDELQAKLDSIPSAVQLPDLAATANEGVERLVQRIQALQDVNVAGIANDSLAELTDSLRVAREELARLQSNAVQGPVLAISEQEISDIIDRISELTQQRDEIQAFNDKFPDLEKKFSSAAIASGKELTALQVASSGLFANLVGPLSAVDAKSRVAFESIVAGIQTPIEQIIALSDKGAAGLKQLSADANLPQVEADLEALRAATVTLTPEMAKMVEAALRAKGGLSGLGDEADYAGAKLRELQLAAARADIGREIALMAAQANESFASIGGGFGERIARLKTQAVELRSAFERALEGIDTKRLQGEFGVKGSEEAAKKEAEYRDSIQKRFNTQSSANERAVRELEAIAAAYDKLLALPVQVRVAAGFGFQAAKLGADAALKSVESLDAAMSRLNLTITEKAALDLRTLRNQESLLLAQLASDKLTAQHREHLEELLELNIRGQQEVDLAAADAVSGQLADALERAFPLVEQARSRLILQLRDINRELQSFASELPIPIRAALAALSEKALLEFDTTQAEEKLRRLTDLQREALGLSRAQLGDFASRFTDIQSQLATSLESAKKKIKEAFPEKAAQDAALKLREGIEGAFADFQLDRLILDVTIQPQIQFEEQLLLQDLQSRMDPIRERLKLLFNDPSLDRTKLEDALRRAREGARRLRDEVFNTGAAFQTGFSAGIEDFVTQATDAFKNGADLARSFGDSLSTMFQSIIDGSASASDAIRQFGISILQEMNKIISQRLAAQLLDSLFGPLLSGVFGSLFGGGGGGSGGLFPGFTAAEGGVMHGRMSAPQSARGLASALGVPMRAYEHGGIARSPQLALFGEAANGEGEAFVPLKSGKIPVQLADRSLGRPERRGTTEINLHFQQSFSSLEPETAAKLVRRSVEEAMNAVIAGLNGERQDLIVSVRDIR